MPLVLLPRPFTFGAGVIVSLIGAGIGGTGGLVMSGSKVGRNDSYQVRVEGSTGGD